jgi:hypothetical protein
VQRGGDHTTAAWRRRDGGEGGREGMRRDGAEMEGDGQHDGLIIAHDGELGGARPHRSEGGEEKVEICEHREDGWV